MPFINVNANSLSIGGTLDTSIHNGRNAGDNGGTIGGNAIINLVVVGGITALDDSQFIGNGGGTIGSNAAIIVSAASLATTDTAPGPLSASINNSGGGNIGGSASINFDLSGNLTSASDANFTIDNSNGGTIGSFAAINASANRISTTGALTLAVLNNDGGHIGGDANIFVTTGAGGDFTANSILAFGDNHNGGTIDLGANITFDIGGALTTPGDATFDITNRNDGSGGGTIGSNVLVNLIAESVSVGGFFETFISTNGGGHIVGNAINTVSATGDLTAQQGILVDIADTIFGRTGNFTGGRIDRDAIVTLSAQNITIPSTNSGIPGTDLMAIEASIYPNASGTVGGDAIVDVSAVSEYQRAWQRLVLDSQR